MEWTIGMWWILGDHNGDKVDILEFWEEKTISLLNQDVIGLEWLIPGQKMLEIKLYLVQAKRIIMKKEKLSNK